MRCSWCEGSDIYERYHDEVWGVPVKDDRLLFEYLTLEGAQAGLNWLSILKRQVGYQQAFDDFDVQKIMAYDESKIESLILDARIIRNKLKIRSVVKNAQAVFEIQKAFGSFSNYLWAYVDHKPIKNAFTSSEDRPSQTVLSQQISKDLKKRGCSFVGPTIIYAFMQAIGMVNDHTVSCFRYDECGR